MPPISIAERVAVYRLFDGDGKLLYIGISANPALRFRQHSHEKPWWPEVASDSVEWFDSRASAAEVEERAVRTELPRYNKMFHPDYQNTEIPTDGVTLTELRASMFRITERVWREREVLFLYSYGRRVAALVPVEVAEQYEAEQRQDAA